MRHILNQARLSQYLFFTQTELNSYPFITPLSNISRTSYKFHLKWLSSYDYTVYAVFVGLVIICKDALFIFWLIYYMYVTSLYWGKKILILSYLLSPGSKKNNQRNTQLSTSPFTGQDTALGVSHFIESCQIITESLISTSSLSL